MNENESRGGLESIPIIGNFFVNRRLDSEAEEVAAANGDYSRIREIIDRLRGEESYAEREQVLQKALKNDEANADLYNKILRAEHVGASLQNAGDPDNKRLIINNVLNRNIATDPVFLDSLLNLIEGDDDLTQFEDILRQRIEEAGSFVASGEAEVEPEMEESPDKPVQAETRDPGELLKRIFTAIPESKGKEQFYRFVKGYEMSSLPPGSKFEFEDHVDEYKKRRAKMAKELSERLSESPAKLEYFSDWLTQLSRGEYMAEGENRIIPVDMQQVLYRRLTGGLAKFKVASEQDGAKKKRLTAAYKRFQSRLRSSLKTDDRYYKIVNNFSIIPLAKEREAAARLSVVEKLLKTIKSNASLTAETKERLENIFDNWIKFYRLKNEQEELKKLEFPLGEMEELGGESGPRSSPFEEALPDTDFADLLPQSGRESALKKGHSDEEGGLPELALLDELRDEHNRMGTVEDLPGKIELLEPEKGQWVMAAIAADPELSVYYEEIEETLYKYGNIWGRALGIIGRKVKSIEERLGKEKSEFYLQELLNRSIEQLGPTHYVVRALTNMLENLKKSHAEQSPKLYKFRQRLAGKSLEEQVKEIGKMARDPYYSSILGHLQRTARNIVNSDDFFNIFDPSHMPHDSVQYLQEIFYDSLPALRKYEPEIAAKLEISLSLMDSQLKAAAKEVPEVSDDLMSAVEKCENDANMEALKEFAAEVADLPSLEAIYAELESEMEGLEEAQPAELLTRQRRLDERASMLRAVYSEDQPLAGEVTEALNKVSAKVEKGIARTELGNRLKNSSDIDEVLTESFNGELFDSNESFGVLGESLARNFTPAGAREALENSVSDGLPEGEEHSRVEELNALLSRIEEEVTPLPTVESRVRRLEFWKDNDYRDNPHLVAFINKYIKEYFILNSREGGLMQIILTGLRERESKEEKLAFLRETLENPLYQHIASTIKILIDNIEKGISIDCSEISEEWIMEQLNAILPDLKGAVNWLRVLKYQDGCDAFKPFIEERMAYLNERLAEQVHRESLVSYKKSNPERVEIHKNIITLVRAVLKLESMGERQSYILEQEMRKRLDRKVAAENIFHLERRTLYHMMSSASDSPRDLVMALAGKRGLSGRERRRCLEVLKKISYSKGTLSLAGELGIGAEDIAYGAIRLFIDDRESLQAKLLLLEELKSSPDHEGERALFEIEPELVDRVIAELKEEALAEPAAENGGEGDKKERELHIYSSEEMLDFVADYLSKGETTARQRFVMDQESWAPLDGDEISGADELFRRQRRAFFYLAPGEANDLRLINNLVRRTRSSFDEKRGFLLALNSLVESQVDELKERILLELADFGVKSSLIRAAAVRLWLTTYAFNSETKSLDPEKVDYFTGLPIAEQLRVKDSQVESVLGQFVGGEELFVPAEEAGYLLLSPEFGDYKRFAARLSEMKGSLKVSRSELLASLEGREELLGHILTELAIFKSVSAEELEIPRVDRGSWVKGLKSVYNELFVSPEDEADKRLFKEGMLPIMNELFSRFEKERGELLRLVKSCFDCKYKYDFSITGADIGSVAGALKKLKGAELEKGRSIETAEEEETPPGAERGKEPSTLEIRESEEESVEVEQPATVEEIDTGEVSDIGEAPALEELSSALEESGTVEPGSGTERPVTMEETFSSRQSGSTVSGDEDYLESSEEALARDENAHFLEGLLGGAAESEEESAAPPVEEEVSSIDTGELHELFSASAPKSEDNDLELLSALGSSDSGLEEELSINSDTLWEGDEAGPGLNGGEDESYLPEGESTLTVTGERESPREDRVIEPDEIEEVAELQESGSPLEETVEPEEVKAEIEQKEEPLEEGGEVAKDNKDNNKEQAGNGEPQENGIPAPFKSSLTELTEFTPLFDLLKEVVKNKKNKLDPKVYTTILQTDIIKQLERQKEVFTFVDSKDTLWGIGYKELHPLIMQKESTLSKENRKIIADKLSKMLSSFPLNKLYSDQVYDMFGLGYGSANNAQMKRFIKKIDSWQNGGQPQQSQMGPSPLDFIAESLNIGGLAERFSGGGKKSPPKKQPKKQPIKSNNRQDRGRKAPPKKEEPKRSRPKKSKERPLNEVIQKSFKTLDGKLTNYLVGLFKHASGPQLEFLRKRYLAGDPETVKSYLWGVAKGSIKAGNIDIQSLFTNYWDRIGFDKEKVLKVYEKRKKK